MARHTPLPRFRLETDSMTERPFSDIRAASASPNMSQTDGPRRLSTLQLQTQRSQNRIRRSACSDLQSTAIPEERVYTENRRRASLFVDRPSPQSIGISAMSSCDQEPAECDYAKLCRLRCQSLYGSLANSNTQSSLPISPLALSGVSFTTVSDDEEDDDDNEEYDDEEQQQRRRRQQQQQQQQSFPSTPINKFRHSLPDTSPTGLVIRNLLRRNKTSEYNHPHRLGLPTNSSQSLYSPTSSSPSLSTNNFPSPLSTFRNFLSLVKLPSSSPSTKSINSTTTSSSSISTTPHHSSLTTLTNSTIGSSATLDQTIISSPSSSISSKKQRPTTTLDTQYRWYFEVGKPIQ